MDQGANTSSSAQQYKVFLSFCGKDTRHGFTDVLYTFFDRAGIRTFRDDNELRVGEEIGAELMKAIKESKILIPVLSENYASSKWCLREVEQMVKCRKSEGQKIYPIFYEIEPSDVRHQSGCYEQAFIQHQTSFDQETVLGWKEALTLVAQLKGRVTKIDEHQGELAFEIFEEVLLVLKTNHERLPKHLVGMEHHEKEMEKLLNVNSSDVRIVVIHGMGGLGKTTIAKFIYNKLCVHFKKHCCFLENVGTRSQDLVKLQNELISQILKINSNDGPGISLEDAVRGRKVFLVLDDLVEMSQFGKLAGECDRFGSGSRIIITTRNKDELRRLENTCQANVYWSYYEPEFMRPHHSLQLFSKHAFMKDLPPLDYIELSKKFVEYAAGLPLVLETIGSSLIGEDTTSWEERLRELEEIPDADVMGKLRISFNRLDYEQQQIFLDIACYFSGHDKTNPCYMWDDLKFFPRRRIKSLVLRSLVKVGDDDKLWMHDQLRDLGRKIVGEENFSYRLWDPVKAREQFENRTITEKVTGLRLNSQSLDDCRNFEGEEFGKLPNLRYLEMRDANLVGDLKHVFPNLRWLSWWGNSVVLDLKNFHLKNLVVLDLSFSYITDESWSQIKMATKLKVLNLTYCTRLTTTSPISTVATLERLIIQCCGGLREIDPSIGNLTKLKLLDLSNCCSLCGVLDCSTFTALESLDLVICSNLRRLDGLEKLESLRYLDLSYCTGLERFPDLSSLKKLTKLVIHACYNLIEIQGVDRLKSLEILDLDGCKSIERLPDLSKLTMLKELNLADCKSIERLPGLSKLTMLKELHLSCCFKLHEVEGLGVLESLERLNMYGCKSKERLPDLSKLGMLKELNLGGCEKLRKIVGLEVLESLKVLIVSELEDLTEIEGLEQLKSLEVLDIDECKSIEILDLSNHKNLKRVCARNCDKLIDIRGLEKLKSLEHLDIDGCYSLQNLLHLPDTSIHSHNSKQTENLLEGMRCQEDGFNPSESPPSHGSLSSGEFRPMGMGHRTHSYNPSESPPSHGSLSSGEFRPMGMGHRTHNGFELLEENFLTLPSELSKTVAVCEDECSSGGGKSESFWVQLSDGGETNGRRVRQRTEDLISNLGK